MKLKKVQIVAESVVLSVAGKGGLKTPVDIVYTVDMETGACTGEAVGLIVIASRDFWTTHYKEVGEEMIKTVKNSKFAKWDNYPDLGIYFHCLKMDNVN